ncbi:DUF7344 domain-containing protein [Natrarchaeobius oligotrophus]|uniref:ArsR family transcriptional regulator n=1 Tax=Natrarchaeobius chitinivorans TaxID=1679083 RepID=A0A3N6N318_NATCH|nr:ArsR family transcriptional regulator [Natrarchaeobius chitinivorans]RQH03282.1 ArsR family transcriptional regulator [Natrarchaeobius chitinivorans]
MKSHEERVVRVLSDPVNRAVLDIVDEATNPVTLSEIAERLVSEDAAICEAAAYTDRLDDRRLTLHHDRLPKLDEAGLLEYDADERVVTDASAERDAQWRELEVIDELLARVGGDERTTPEIGLLEGRDAIFEYGRELAERTEEELFLIYTSDELLGPDCLPDAENAIGRGVDFYAGGTARSVRRFFREHLPNATVWEPQLDWMNDRTKSTALSRLIVSDRKRVAVGLWNERGETKREVGLIGEGRDNPLVVLVRELLGPRLDHLDYQSDAFLGDLPFET